MKTYSDSVNPHVDFPMDAKPSLLMNHIDGPLLTFSDGQMHWLTLWERLLVKIGYHNAQSLQCKLRPHLTSYLARKEFEASDLTPSEMGWNLPRGQGRERLN